jgi:ATP-binding cassette, subfamily B, bacterial
MQAPTDALDTPEFEARTRNPYWALLRTAWHYARDQRPRYLLVYGMFVLSNLFTALEPIVWGVLINALQQADTNALREAGWYAGVYLLLQLVIWAFHGPARLLERELAFRLSRNFLDELYRKVLSLPVKWHQDHHSGSTINRVRKAYEALKSFFENGFMYFSTFIKFTLSFGAMVWFSPTFGLLGVGLGVLTIWIIMRFDRPLIRELDAVNEREHVVSATLFDTLSNIITVITLRLESRLQRGLTERVNEILPPFRREVWLNEWKWFVADMLVGLIYVVMVWGYVWQNWQPGQPFLIGNLVVLAAYVVRFTSAFHDVAWQYNEIVRLNTDLQTTRYIFEAYDRQHRPEALTSLPTDWKSLEINNLLYNHAAADSTHPVAISQGLADLSVRIGRGQRIALIGESGCGKSTLLAVMRGLYPPAPGFEVRLDDHLWADWAAISEVVTLFPQEPEIFENTIRYNITLGLPFSDEEVMAVCDTAHFSEVVAMLPKGLDSSIQEKGVNLSGGQKQRLALARGILAARTGDIVLLDEPTSSVDPKTEALIYDRLFAEFADKAIVSSLHRLHLLTKFDYVYVMQQGRVVEQGTFEYLRAEGPVFRELWEHQEQGSDGF